MHEARKLRTTNFSSFNEIKLIEKHTSMSFRVVADFLCQTFIPNMLPLLRILKKTSSKLRSLQLYSVYSYTVCSYKKITFNTKENFTETLTNTYFCASPPPPRLLFWLRPHPPYKLVIVENYFYPLIINNAIV